MTKQKRQIAGTDEGEGEKPLLSDAGIRELQFDLNKTQGWLKKSRERVKTLEEQLDGHGDEVEELRESNTLIQARLDFRDAEIDGLRTAANTSGMIALVAGTGLLIALLMLL